MFAKGYAGSGSDVIVRNSDSNQTQAYKDWLAARKKQDEENPVEQAQVTLESLLAPTVPAVTPPATPSPVAPAASPTAPTVAPMAQNPQQQSQIPTPMPQPSVLSSLPGSLSPSTSYAMSGISQGMRPKKRRPMFQPYGGSGGVTGLPGL